MTLSTPEIKRLANTIRFLAADGVEAAHSGHPGMPMGAADYAALLWSTYLRFNPKDTGWANRDRFVLSAGHGSMLIYSLLHLFGYDLSLDELKRFRQWGSLTPGHPEFGITPGVETTTGPLGQGIANAVGLALSGKMLQARYDTELFNYRVFGIAGDGDLMEGVASEAASLAGHLALNNLVFFYDDNHISIGGSTDVTFTESVGKRFEAYGWYVQSVDGHDIEACAKALDNAIAEEKRPSLICARTTIGFGAPKKAGTAGVHGEPLGEEELNAAKDALGWPKEPRFLIPKEVGEFCCRVMAEKTKAYEEWQSAFSRWCSAVPDKAAVFMAQARRELPSGLAESLVQACSGDKPDATRNISGKALNAIALKMPALVGGSADLEPSTKTLIKDSPDVQPGQYQGKNLRFGVREHGMGAIANGLAYTQMWIPYTATFLVFADYMRPTIRLAALSHLQTLFIFTHDSIFLGEDGPTHQPIEHIASLRIIPNLYVFRPADGFEVAASYIAALELKKSPSALLFTRQNLPPLPNNTRTVDDIRRGAYIVQEFGGDDLVFVATGSEVSLALQAAEILHSSGKKVRVVSMPCVELFLEQAAEQRDSIIPPHARKIVVEAAEPTGWERVVGANALLYGIRRFGASAPANRLAEEFGFTPKHLAEAVLQSESA